MSESPDTSRLLAEIIADPERKVSPEEAEALFVEYPYFVYPQIRAFPDASGSADRELIRRRIAMNIGDTVALRTMLGVDPEEFASFYPDMAPVSLSTEDTIDSFLTRFGRKTVATDDLSLVAAPAIDYASTLMGDSADNSSGENAGDSTSSAIDSFLKAVPAPTPSRGRPVVATSPVVDEDAAPHEDAAEAETENYLDNQDDKSVSSASRKDADATALTESLARVMIKNKNYRKALEIIMELNLKNPEKSIYFADQIRFLRKLIISESKS